MDENDFKRLYQQEWPPATMTAEQCEANRRCPHGGGRHDCDCKGECPWRISKERELAARQRKVKRDGRWL